MPTIKKNVCCHPTNPDILPLPIKLSGLPEKDLFYFMFSDSFFSISSVFPFKNAENVLL